MSALSITLAVLGLMALIPFGQFLLGVGTLLCHSRAGLFRLFGLVAIATGFISAVGGGLGLVGMVVYGAVTLAQHFMGAA